MNNDVPYFLEAKTKEELYFLMLANNKRHLKQFHYFDFTYAQGKWTCWFQIKLSEKIEKSNGD